MKDFLNYLLRGIGECSVCMRQAFQISFGSWALTLALVPTNLIPLVHLGFILSVGLTMLWLTHLLTYAARNVALTGTAAIGPAASAALFFKSVGFMAAETASFFRAVPTDRFGKPVGRRAILVELKNPDGTRTAFFKNPADIDHLVVELKSRGYIGLVTEPEYWMSTDSCERSNGSKCKDHTCDKTTESCKQTGVGMAYCKCS